MGIFFLLIALVLLLPDAYVLFCVMAKSSWVLKAIFLLPTLVYFTVIVRMFLFGDFRQLMLNLLFWLTLCVVFPIVIFSLISIIGRGIGLIWSNSIPIFNIIASVVAVCWLVMSLYGICFGWKKITIDEVSICSTKIPKSFNNYRIVQLSDFHIGTYSSSPETVTEIVESVNSLHPDLILFTGDLVNSTSTEIDEFKDILRRLKARDGIFSVLGNHDYCLYRDYKAPDTPEQELARVIRIEDKIGWKLLRNENTTITKDTDSIAIIGVDNAGSRMFPDKSNLPKAIQGLDKDVFKILLSHDPSHWRREVLPCSDIDLTLSGHTHAMQFKIANWSPSKWTYPEWGGLYKDNNRLLYVSTGIGENITFRFGAWPQIVLLTLHHSEE